MNNPQPSQRIVVGIDGSDAAIDAARWAAADAASRNIPLRLIHAISQRHTDASGDDSLQVEYGQASLRAADEALQAMGKPVEVECDLLRDSPEGALVDESRSAAMVCVGSVGTGWAARKILGSTAETVARKARCPMAVIRNHRDIAEPDGKYIAVAVEGSVGDDAVLEEGFRQARLRDAPILAMGMWRWGFGEIPYRQLDHRLGPWVSRYRDVHVQPAAARHGIAEFLTRTQEPVQLAVVGTEDADQVARIVGPVNRDPNIPLGYSVLVVRA